MADAFLMSVPLSEGAYEPEEPDPDGEDVPLPETIGPLAWACDATSRTPSRRLAASELECRFGMMASLGVCAPGCHSGQRAV